jgi:hypothetical protein
MASAIERLRALIASPKGQRLIEQGRKQLSKPENQEKIQRLRGRTRRTR